MTMNRTTTVFVFFVLSQLALATTLVLTSAQLPERVASHFDAFGKPNAWMSRTAYLWLMFGVGSGLSLFLVGIFYVIRFMPTSLINLPRREYWLAPERRQGAFAFMLRSGVWFATLESVFMLGVHLLVVAANRAQPVQLSSGIWLLMGSFLVVTGGWSFCLIRRFQQNE